MSLVPYSEPFVRHHPWFDSAMDLFNYLAFYLGLTVFIITLAFLAIKAALCSLTPIIVVKYLGLDPEIPQSSGSTSSRTPTTPSA